MKQITAAEKCLYGPIRKKIEEWIWYDDHEPKSSYRENREEHDSFRAGHDRDCVLTGGDLRADTLFSLWLPLRHTMERLNDREKIRSVGNISRKYDFLRELIKGDNLEKLLPAEEPAVQQLSLLFAYGLGRGNVFILPDRRLNCARARKPYWDYMPVFLLESFQGGAFADYWNSPEDYLQWIHREHLEMFFEGGISPDHIIDLSRSGDVRISLAPEGICPMEHMLNNYLYILMKREKIFRESAGIFPGDIYYPKLPEMSEEEIDLIYRMDNELIEERGGNSCDDFRWKKLREKLDFFHEILIPIF